MTETVEKSLTCVLLMFTIVYSHKNIPRDKSPCKVVVLRDDHAAPNFGWARAHAQKSELIGVLVAHLGLGPEAEDRLATIPLGA